MSQSVPSERVAAMAAAARVSLPADAPARIAGAVGPVVQRFAVGDCAYPFEAEPATFLAVAHRDAEADAAR
ncbi:MAG: hypothetical protein IT538_11160 [Variibacter sp.]|nr:hypothetical protein [Variibacter sp.]